VGAVRVRGSACFCRRDHSRLAVNFFALYETGTPDSTMEAGNSRLEPLRLPRAAGMVPLELQPGARGASRSSAPFWGGF